MFIAPMLAAVGGAVTAGAATGATAAAVGSMALGTAASAIGSVVSGIGQKNQLDYQAQIAQNNAISASYEARSALLAGDTKEADQKLKAGTLAAHQQAAMAASGVDLGSVTAGDIGQSTAFLSDLDAAAVHQKAAMQAYGFRVQSNNYYAQAQADRAAGQGALLGGFLKAGTSLLGGASSISGKMSMFRATGAAGAG